MPFHMVCPFGRGMRGVVLRGIVFLWCLMTAGHAAVDVADDAAWNTALRDFDLQTWDRAEKSLGEYLERFPQSAHGAEATQRRDYAHAEVLFSRGDFAGATSAFASFQHQHPQAPRAALAAVREASARLQTGDAAGAVRTLVDPDSAFARALAAGSPPDVLFRGLMVQAQAWLAASDPVRAVQTLESAKPWGQPPVGEFSRLQTLAIAREKIGDPTAVSAAQEAVDLAAREPSLAAQRPSSIAFLADLLVRMSKPEAAAEWYQRNLASGVPLEYQRQATLELTRQRLAAGDIAGARQRLEAFLATQALDPEILPLRLLLGQVLFRQYEAVREQANLAEASALLNLAGSQYLLILTNGPKPEIAGPASMGRGWCLWEEGATRNGTNRLVEAETNFLNAVRLLPEGEGRHRARFKVGDCQLARGDAARALASYRQVAEESSSNPAFVSLTESSWRQVGVAAAQLQDRGVLLLARDKLLALNPRSEATVRTTLLASQLLLRLGDGDQSRLLLSNFLAQSADSPFRPDLELALAGSDLRAQRWSNAIPELDQWISANPQHPQLPRAMWDRAWAMAQARMLTNAALEFARLAAQFPAAASAGQAQLWLADDYFSRREYDRAGLACNILITNEVWRGKPEWYRAKFLAAESARKLENWRDAGILLFDLLNDKEVPAFMLPSAYFALGEFFLSCPPDEIKLPDASSDKSPDAAYNKALEAFRKVASYTNSPLSPAAMGWMANCYLQKAARATNFYGTAIELYGQVLRTSTADSAVRSEAAFGGARAFESWAVKLAASGDLSQAREIREGAVNQLLDLLHGKWLQPGEAPDPSLVEKAGRLAGEIFESMGRWGDASRLYRWLAGELPVQKAAWEAKAATAARQVGA